jgi:phage-related minor tail protein
MQRAMRDIERSSQRVGQYLGDAATALVTGAASWRDIAQQVIQDMIRAGLTQGFTSISQSFLSGFAATPAQTTAPT